MIPAAPTARATATVQTEVFRVWGEAISQGLQHSLRQLILESELAGHSGLCDSFTAGDTQPWFYTSVGNNCPLNALRQGDGTGTPLPFLTAPSSSVLPSASRAGMLPMAQPSDGRTSSNRSPGSVALPRERKALPLHDSWIR